MARDDGYFSIIARVHAIGVVVGGKAAGKMQQRQLSIWTNAKLPVEANKKLIFAVAPHKLIYAAEMSSLNLHSSPPDQQLEDADVALGQPDPEQIMQSRKLKWVHLTTAGYTPYDRDDLRITLQTRQGALTTSSGVYDEPCAQHVLGMMMAFARQLPHSLSTQLTDRTWPAVERRRQSFLLNGQTAVLFGFGEIAKRLCELLAPFQMNLIGVRRRSRGNESIQLIDESQLVNTLPIADHLINVLPSNASTAEYFDSFKFSLMKQGAYFYNIGRGATVDQHCLAASLKSGALAGAYLDVMEPEPLPSDHALWNTPNCFITPHSAGGYDGEMMGLVNHFLENLSRYTSKAPLLNRVI